MLGRASSNIYIDSCSKHWHPVSNLSDSGSADSIFTYVMAAFSWDNISLRLYTVSTALPLFFFTQWKKEFESKWKKKVLAFIYLFFFFLNICRRQEIKGGHNLDDTQVAACVLADVQQKQAQEIESILLEMQYKVRTHIQENGLFLILLGGCRGHFSNSSIPQNVSPWPPSPHMGADLHLCFYLDMQIIVSTLFCRHPHQNGTFCFLIHY